MENAARIKDFNKGPHRCRHSRILTPNNSIGVASCILTNCSILAPEDPPLGSTPTDPSTNAIAIAVTGGPRSFPRDVVFPSRWDMDAVAVRHAMFPNVSVGEIRGNAILGKALRTWRLER